MAATVSMAWLISGDVEKLTGPLGDEFIGAIRDRFPNLASASIQEISEHMAEYGPDQIAGVINMVKGKLFERLVERHENGDADAWRAVLHEDESFPGSDIVFINVETGEQIEISLKATDSPAYLESSLARYPDYPIIATDEVVDSMGDDHLIWAAGITNKELEDITEENFEQLSEMLEPLQAAEVAAGGVAAGALVRLWPYVVAYMRGNITKDQLTVVCLKVLPESGKVLASRLIYAAALGPVFAWWLLARGVLIMTPIPEGDEPYKVRKMILQTALK